MDIKYDTFFNYYSKIGIFKLYISTNLHLKKRERERKRREKENEIQLN